MAPHDPQRDRRRPAKTGPRKPRHLPKTFSADEVAALLAVPNLRAPTGLRNRALLEVMHQCGLRVSEACGLHLRDIRWTESKIHVRTEVAKGGKEAFVTFDAQAGALLRRWIDCRRQYAAGKPHLFVTLAGGPVDRRYVWSMIGRYARRAGIDRHVHPHMLRHTYATELLAEGFALREVQHLMRHDDVRTTTIYTHIAEAELDDRVRRRRTSRP